MIQQTLKQQKLVLAAALLAALGMSILHQVQAPRPSYKKPQADLGIVLYSLATSEVRELQTKGVWIGQKETAVTGRPYKYLDRLFVSKVELSDNAVILSPEKIKELIAVLGPNSKATLIEPPSAESIVGIWDSHTHEFRVELGLYLLPEHLQIAKERKDFRKTTPENLRDLRYPAPTTLFRSWAPSTSGVVTKGTILIMDDGSVTFRATAFGIPQTMKFNMARRDNDEIWMWFQ